MSLRSGLPRAGVSSGPRDDLPHLAVAVLGGVGHGKTSLVSALSLLLATRGWAAGLDVHELDAQDCERARGQSVELSHVVLHSARRRYTLIDCPGHPDYLRNTLAGLAQADCALFVVNAELGPDVALRDQAVVARHLGVAPAVVFLGHADRVEEEDYRALVEHEVRELLTRCGYEADEAPVVHGSATRAAASLTASAEAADDEWTRPLWGLLAALDALPPRPRGDAGAPALPIEDVFKDPEHGVIVTGRLERGTLYVDQELELFGLPDDPGGRRHPVLRMWSRHVEVTRARAGDFVGLPLPWMQALPGLKRGLVLGAPGSLTPRERVQISLQTLPPELGDRRFVPLDHRVVLHLHAGTAMVSATLGRPTPGHVRAGKRCACTIELARPLIVLPRWRYVLRDAQRTVGLGAPVADGPGERPGP